MANQYTVKKDKNRRPSFTLLASDNFSTTLIQKWIGMAEEFGVDEEKIASVRAIKKQFEEWRTKNPTACKTPD